MLISRQSLLFRWVYLPRILKGGTESLPTKVNLCPFFWRTVLSPFTNLVLLPVFALLCTSATIVLWVIALALGKHIVYKETHWDESRGKYMKNHFLWDFLTKYKEKGSYRDSFTWSMESIRWIPYVFGLRLNLIIFSSTVLVLYAQFWGWVNVFYGVWPWKLSFVGDFKGFILAGIWMATSGFALLIVCIFCFVLTIDSKVAEIAKEFIEAKKNRWCPEIEIV